MINTKAKEMFEKLTVPHEGFTHRILYEFMERLKMNPNDKLLNDEYDRILKLINEYEKVKDE